MSNGGPGDNYIQSSGLDGVDGEPGLFESYTSLDTIIIHRDIQIGGHGGDGEVGRLGGYGGGGGGGAGGGGAWPAGVGGSGGAPGEGGLGGHKGLGGIGSLLVFNNSTFTNEGDIFCRGGSSVQLDTLGVFINSGIMESENEIDYSVFNLGRFLNSGTYQGWFTNRGDLSGSGQMTGVVYNTGAISPGEDFGNDIGTITIGILDDSYSSSFGSVNIQLGGSDPDHYDVLAIDSFIIRMRGTLNLEFVQGMTESDLINGDYFDIIQYPAIAFEHSLIINDELAPLTDGTWELEYDRLIDDQSGMRGTRLTYVQDLSPVPVSEVPTTFALNEVFPNPFNPQTTVSYELPESCSVSFRVFDVAGRLVWTKDTLLQPAGHHNLTWKGTDIQGRNLSSGTYLLRMTAKGFQATRQMVLIR